METFYVTCIKPYEYEGVVFYRKGQICKVLGFNNFRKAYRVSSEKGENLINQNRFDEHFKKIEKLLRIEFVADFSTDDDFHFEEKDLKNFESSMSTGANVNYSYSHPFSDDISFSLIAEGSADACRWTLRDLIQEMMVSIRTYDLKHYLVKEIYELLEKFYDVIWDEAPISMTECMSGNYDGTEIFLSIKEIDEMEDPKTEPEFQPNSFIEITVQEVKKLQCPHCKAIHPHNDYVQSFNHCPACGKEV